MLSRVAVQQRARVRLAAVLRDGRVLHVPGRAARTRCSTPSLGAGVMGIWSATSTTAGVGAAARALARDARAARRRADAVLAGPAADHDRDVDDRPLLDGRDARSGAGSLFGIDAPRSSTRSLFVLAVAGDDRRDRDARLPARRVVRPLPHRLGAREPARVPGLAGLRLPRAARRCFPGWVRPISWVLAPTWGMRAIRESALGGPPWPDLAHVPRCSAAVYIAIGVLVVRARARARARANATPVADVNGIAPGLLRRRAASSYRALFNWLSPWIFIPTLAGRRRSSRSCSSPTSAARPACSRTTFYVIGNALQYAAIPCLFAMSNTIAGERYQQTLGVHPGHARPAGCRSSSGRSLPVIVNGSSSPLFALAVGGADARRPRARRRPSLPLVLVVAVTALLAAPASGWSAPALGLRVRETAVLANILFGVLLVFCGANVPLDELPGWMQHDLGRGCRSRTGSRPRGGLADGESLSRRRRPGRQAEALIGVGLRASSATRSCARSSGRAGASRRWRRHERSPTAWLVRVGFRSASRS